MNGNHFKPNLFIIGAAKCGTTSLHNYLNAHPQIFMSPFKEPGFFLGPTKEKVLSRKYRDVDNYLSLFSEGVNSKYRG